nr:oxidoreductase [Paraburkholderia tuberum]
MQPCVSQLDGTGTVVEHGIVHTVPYLRIQGGSNAVILDPQPGDIGLVVVCDRDTSSARANRDVSAPGSLRKFDMSDSVYVATVLSGPPSQYVLIGPNGIDIVSPVRIRMLAPTIIMQADDQIGLQAGASVDTAAPVIGLDGAMTQGDGGFGGGAHIRSTLTADQDVVGGGKSLHDHTHRDSEGGTTSPPL